MRIDPGAPPRIHGWAETAVQEPRLRRRRGTFPAAVAIDSSPLDLTSASRAAERADSVRSIEAIVTDQTSVTIAAFGDRRRSHRRLKGGVPDLVVKEVRYVFPLSE